VEIGTGAELTRLQNHVLTNTHGTTRVSSCCTSQGVFKGRKKHKEKKPRGHSAVFVRTRKLKENPGNSPKETVFFFNLRVRTNTAECPLGFFSLCFLRPLKTPCEVQQLETLVVPCVLVRT
jgi:hypothetical protein